MVDYLSKNIIYLVVLASIGAVLRGCKTSQSPNQGINKSIHVKEIPLIDPLDDEVPAELERVRRVSSISFPKLGMERSYDEPNDHAPQIPSDQCVRFASVDFNVPSEVDLEPPSPVIPQPEQSLAPNGPKKQLTAMLMEEVIGCASNSESGLWGFTKLHWAVLSGKTDSIELVLSLPDLDPNKLDQKGYTPLHRAIIDCKAENIPVIELLLAHEKIDPNVIDQAKGATALHYAAAKNKFEVVKRLMCHPNLNPNIKDGGGQERSPLHLGAYYGAVESVKEMLKYPQVQVNLRGTVHGYSALDFAVDANQPAVVRELLKREDLDINGKNNYGATALHKAAAADLSEVVQLLLDDSRIEPETTDEKLKGVTPLHSAVEGAALKAIPLLLAHIKVDPNTTADDGMFPLRLAILNEDPKAVAVLLDHPFICVNTPDKNGNTPLHLAVKRRWRSIKMPNANIERFINNRIEIVKLLLAKDEINLSAKNKNNETPKRLAYNEGRDFDRITKLIEDAKKARNNKNKKRFWIFS